MSFSAWTDINNAYVYKLYFIPNLSKNNNIQFTEYVFAKILNVFLNINLVTDIKGVIESLNSLTGLPTGYNPEIFLNSFVSGEDTEENFFITFINNTNVTDTNIYYFTNVTNKTICTAKNISSIPQCLFSFNTNQVIVKGTGASSFFLFSIENNSTSTLFPISESPFSISAPITAVSANQNENQSTKQIICVNGLNLFYGTFDDSAKTIIWDQTLLLQNVLNGKICANPNLFTRNTLIKILSNKNKILLFGNETGTNFLIIKQILGGENQVVLQKSYLPAFYVDANNDIIMFVVGGTGVNDYLEVLVFDNNLNQIYAHQFTNILASSVASAICAVFENQLFVFVNFKDPTKLVYAATSFLSICLLPDCDILLSDLTYKNITQVTLHDTVLGALSQQPQKIVKIYKNTHPLQMLPQTNQPVLISKNNFAENVPDKNIHLSGHHRIILKNKETETFLGIQAFKLLPTKENFDNEKTVDYYHLVLQDTSEGFIVNGLQVESCQE